MKQLGKFLMASVLFLLAVPANARIAGGEIGWEYLGKDTLKVIVRGYRDCNGVSMPNVPITLRSSCGTKTLSTSMRLVNDITPVCDEQCTRCVSGGCSFKYGFQVYELTATVILSDWVAKSCCNVTFSYHNCCRTHSITTGAARQTFYLEAQLNICSSPLNLSWNNDPVTVIGLGRDFVGVTSVKTGNSSDSIVYSFDRPRRSPVSYTSWNFDYAENKPLSYWGFPRANLSFPKGIHYDSLTGEMMCRPMKEEATIICTKAEVYRRGVKVAQTTRDVILAIIRSPTNHPPELSGANCTQPKPNNFNMVACAGQKLDFEICTSDKDIGDTVSLLLDYDIPKAQDSLKNPKGRTPSRRFIWTPDSNDVTDQPHMITARATDNACPVNAMSARQFRIRVHPSPNFRIDYKVEKCGQVVFVAKSSDTVSADRFEWLVDGKTHIHSKKSTSDTLTVLVRRPGWQQVRLRARGFNGCAPPITDSFYLPDNFIYLKRTSDTTVCSNDSIKLNVRIKNPKGTFKLIWSNGDSTLLSSASRDFWVGNRDTFETVTYRDTACKLTDTLFISSKLPPRIQLLDTVFHCIGDTSIVQALHQPLGNFDRDTVRFQWSAGSSAPVQPIHGGKHLSSIRVGGSGGYKLETRDTLGCVSMDSTYVKEKLSDIDFSLVDIKACDDQEFTIGRKSTASSHFNWAYKLPNRQFFVKGVDSFKHIFRESVDMMMEYVDSSHGVTCQLFDTFHIEALKAPSAHITHVSGRCQGDTVIFSATPDSGFWTVNNATYIGNRLETKLPAGKQKIAYTGLSENGCQDTDSKTLNIVKKPNAKFTLADTVFTHTTVTAWLSEGETTAHRYDWSIGDPVFDSFTGYRLSWSFDTTGTFPMTLRVTNTKFGCTSSTTKEMFTIRRATSISPLYSSIFVYPNPSSGVLHVEGLKGEHGYRLVGVSGQTLLEGSIDSIKNAIDASDLTNGIYFLSIDDNPIQKVFISHD